jgi:NADPH:quinone reductase-like Zn-dependent oxidoreductase/NAD(P)-dependent dehydrogenase (short-subunit alcohol dehydrogenase family)
MADLFSFRDVMVAMGQIPDGTLGFEASGIVTRVGSNATRLKVGDHVCTIGKGTHKTLFRSKEMLCQLIPEGLSFEEAASLPLIHSTAFQALVRIARIRKGQSILIHAAAGGVGQAAIQLAKHYDAEIFATVGSEEKKQLIMDAYGIPADHILNSRDLSFSKGIMRMTKGKGVDIVLNSLSGEALRETWHCIAPFGTFVEIGIKDILSNSGLDMLPFLRDATFAFVNLEHIGRANPSLMSEIMEGTFELLRSSTTKAVTPLTTYPASQIEDAFRIMQTGQHKGKVVISYSNDDIVPVLAGDPHPLKLDPDGTYILVGGLGGLGRSLATFLARHGARHLAFLSRSGALSDQAKSVLQTLQEEGIDAKTYRCDTAEASQLSATVSQLSTEMPPIRGLINGAMVLRDSMFQNMTHEQWTIAIRPKVHGSWNLHSLIPNDHLDFFILLSSNVGIFGNRGQANYAAGCTFQDALARHRRSKGLTATSIDLGIMLEIGYIAETGVDALKDWEFSGLNESEFHTIMKAAITGYSKASNPVSAQLVTGLITGGAVTEFGIDTPYYHDNPQMAIQAKTGKQVLSTSDSGASSSLQEQLSSVKSLFEAAVVVTDALVGKVAKSLRTDVMNIEIGKPLHSFGVDSLVAVEIRNWIFREIKSEVSLFDVMSSVPISVLAEKVAGKSKFVAAGVVSEG